MSDAPDVLVYPRFVRSDRGSGIDNSSVIAHFLVGQDFTDRTSAERKVYTITRIDRDGIWGVEREQEPAMESSK